MASLRPVRIAMIAIVALAVAMTVLLAPAYSPLFVPLGLYTVVLTVMTTTSFTLPASRWLPMAGAVALLGRQRPGRRRRLHRRLGLHRAH